VPDVVVSPINLIIESKVDSTILNWVLIFQSALQIETMFIAICIEARCKGQEAVLICLKFGFSRPKRLPHYQHA